MSQIIATAAVEAPQNAAKRGHWNEIVSLTIDGQDVRPSSIIAEFSAALPETFVEFDKKQRGDALNLDLYGYDPVQGVAVVQIRHAFRQYRKGFLNVRKDYVLVGRNEETGEFFRHPISAGSIHAGIRKDETNPVAAVRAAQRWMWNVNDSKLRTGIRQGDILMVPERGKPAGGVPIDEAFVTVAGTHEVHASEFMRDRKGVIYALAPTMRHTKGQHCAAFGDGDGWHSIRVGREADTWKWGERLGD